MSDILEIERSYNLRKNVPLGQRGWFATGGQAETLLKPQDKDELIAYLKENPDDPVHIFGVLSNTIIRDGGIDGTVVRLGRAFSEIKRLDNNRIFAGAIALDRNVAQFAAREGIAGLEFFSGVPGSIGGALRMNAGCYGTETKDVLVEAFGVTRDGRQVSFSPEELKMRYRHSEIPDGVILTGAIFEGVPGVPEKIQKNLEDLKIRRETSQPIREKTGGSTFANPSAEDLAKAGLPETTKTWQLIDKAGGRGLRVGGAMMSHKHCNFMINTGTACAADLESLGEEIRRRVFEQSGVSLRWEIRRVGRKPGAKNG